jgi:uncharacterized protein (DUF433 family)
MKSTALMERRQGVLPQPSTRQPGLEGAQIGKTGDVTEISCAIGRATGGYQHLSHEAAMTFTSRIEINPRVMLGKPVIRGTRIPVELLLRKLGEGASEADLLDAYPRLTREDIQAAIRYAADTLAHEQVVFIGTDPPHRD